MTEHEQRIKIAEACGWQGPHHPKNLEGMAGWQSQNRGIWWVSPQGERVLTSSVPDYLNDLNAMHETEKVLDRNQKNRYLNMLHEICLPDDYDELDDDFNWCTATAAQRAEAFLKTLNLWAE